MEAETPPEVKPLFFVRDSRDDLGNEQVVLVYQFDGEDKRDYVAKTLPVELRDRLATVWLEGAYEVRKPHDGRGSDFVYPYGLASGGIDGVELEILAAESRLGRPRAMPKPEVEFKGLKTFRAMEGVGYNVTVYVDGRKSFLCDDAGNGGDVDITVLDADSHMKLARYAAISHPEFGGDSVALIVEDEMNRQRDLKLIRNKTIISVPSLNPVMRDKEFAYDEPYNTHLRERILKQEPTAIFLNDTLGKTPSPHRHWSVATEKTLAVQTKFEADGKTFTIKEPYNTAIRERILALHPAALILNEYVPKRDRGELALEPTREKSQEREL